MIIRTPLFFSVILGTFLSCNAQDGGNEDEYAREVIAYTSAWIRDGKRTVENYWNRGLAYHHLDSLDLAWQDFTSALKIDSLNASLYDRRASVNYDRGRYRESLADYDRAISLDGNNLSFRVARGSTKVQLNDLPGAEDDFSLVLRIDSTNELALYNRAIMYWDVIEKQTSVLSDLNRLVRHYPQGEYFYHRGQYYVKLNKYQVALADFEMALELEARNKYFQVERAYCLGMLRRNSEAKAAFTAAQKLDDKNPFLYWRRGLWRSHQKNDSLSCADFRKAKSLGLQLDDHERRQFNLLLSKCR